MLNEKFPVFAPRVQAEEVFHALGRVPNTAGLGLETVGVHFEQDRIVTNLRMQTNLSHIYAAGDCTGLHEIVHVAIQQGEVAAYAIEGTREIGFAVIATTISLIAVFTPLAFLKGATGRLFNEFGVAVAGAVAISGVVALTLTPMLCARSSG